MWPKSWRRWWLGFEASVRKDASRRAHRTKGVTAVGASGTVIATSPAGIALSAGASASFTLVVKVSAGTPSGTDISNTAMLAFAWDTDSANNSATRTVRVR